MSARGHRHSWGLFATPDGLKERCACEAVRSIRQPERAIPTLPLLKLRARAYNEAAKLLERAMDGCSLTSDDNPDLTEEDESKVREYIRNIISAELRAKA